jgi:flagellar motility protein MotE (MotC chaperone)
MADKSKGKGKGKAILGIIILLIIIILLPVIIFGSIYFLNEDFRLEANRVLRDAPGSIGNYFEKMPTESEKQTQIMEIAMYMLDIDKLRAVDKLEKIKSEDAKLYDNIIKYMIRDNPNRTKDILDVVRSHEINEDLIISTINEIEQEVNDELKDDATELMNLTLSLAKEQMEDIINSSVNGYLLLAETLKNLEDENIAKLLDVLDSEDFNIVINKFSKDQQNKIKKIISNNRTTMNDLNNIIEIYKTKNSEYLSAILMENGQYSMDELVYIYEELGPKLSGKVLAKTKNEEFVVLLTSKIKENQILTDGEDILTKDILKSLKLFSEYDDNLNELTDIYLTMDSQKVADALEGMMRSSIVPEIYALDNGETIEISDEDIAIEILNNFNENKKGEIIGLMTDSMASQVSRKLSIPLEY